MTPEELSETIIEIFLRIDKINMYRNLAPNLSAKETDILMTLYFHEYEYGEGLTVKGISKTYQVTNATTIQFINALEREGYVERQQDSKDRRVTHVVLTEFGRKIAKLVDTDHHHVMKQLLDEQGENLIQAMAQVKKMLDTIEAIPLKQLTIERQDSHARD